MINKEDNNIIKDMEILIKYLILNNLQQNIFHINIYGD